MGHQIPDFDEMIQSRAVNPRIAVFDLDLTLTRRDTFLPYLAGFVLRHPSQILRCWSLPFDLLNFFAGFSDRATLKAAFLKKCLSGANPESLGRWTRKFAADVKSGWMRTGALLCLEEHRSAGDRLILASASPDLYVVPIADLLGFESVLATRCELGEGKLTCRLVGPNLKGLAKSQAVSEKLGEKVDRSRVVAYGDDRSDLPLLTWAGHGVVINPGPALAAEAQERGLEVVYW